MISMLGNDNEEENFDVSLDWLSHAVSNRLFNRHPRSSHQAFAPSPSAALLFPGIRSSRAQSLTAGMHTMKNTFPLQWWAQQTRASLKSGERFKEHVIEVVVI